MNGWFDSIFGGDSNLAVGKQVLSAYFNEAINFTEFTYPSYDAWVSFLESRVPGYVEFIGELVKANYAATSVEAAASRLADLAYQSSGTASITNITQTAGGRGDTVNWSAALPDVAKESASDLVDIAENVGTGVIGSLNMVKYLPVILLGAGALFIYVYASKGGGLLKRGK